MNRSRRRSGLLLLSLAVAGTAACSSPLRTGAVRRAAQSRSCPAPITGAAAVLTPGTLLLLGELHGTAEIPHFVGDLACEASLEGRRVQLGLEIPGEEQPHVNAFLASAGAPRDHEALLASDFWRRPYQDGRSSRAMFELLESVRRLRKEGANIAVFLFDQTKPGPNRDAEMANSIRAAHEQAPDDLFLILTGNLHARKKKVTIGTTELVPMGFHLAQAGGRVTSLNNSYPSGSAWVCIGKGNDACGSRRMSGKPRGAARFIELTGIDEIGYDGSFYVTSLTASSPAATP